MSTQRNGTGGRPVWYQTAVSETTSTFRTPAPYQLGTRSGVQPVVGSPATAARVGRRLPLRRGRPTWRGRRGGAGSYSAASSRKRVIIVTGWDQAWHPASSSRAA